MDAATKLKRVQSMIQFEPRGAMLLEPSEGWDVLCTRIRDGWLGAQINTWAPRRNEDFGVDGDYLGHMPLLTEVIGRAPREVTFALLAAGADPNLPVVPSSPPNALALFPLGCAVGRGCGLEVVSALLDAGADPNANKRLPVLHQAASKGDLELVRLLLKHGADPLARTPANSTALVFALRRNRTEIATVLRDAGTRQLENRHRSSLVVKDGEPDYDVIGSRGVIDFAKTGLHSSIEWIVLITPGNVETTAGLLNAVSNAAAWEKNASERQVRHAAEVWYVVRLQGCAWTIVFMWLGERLGHRAVAREKAEHAAELSRKATSCILFEHLAAQVYEDGAIVEVREWSVEDEPRYDSEAAFERRERTLLLEMNQWFVQKGVFIPRAVDIRDGYVAQIALYGIKKSDVERLDVLVVRENET